MLVPVFGKRRTLRPTLAPLFFRDLPNLVDASALAHRRRRISGVRCVRFSLMFFLRVI